VSKNQLPPPRPYVDRPVGDIDTADSFATSAARELGLAPPERMRVGMNALYACGDVVLRVGRPSTRAELAIELAERLAELGIAVPCPMTRRVVEREGIVATAWHRIEPVADPVDWVAVGGIVRRVHGLRHGDLPSGYPVPSPTAFPWWDFDAVRADVAVDIDAAALAGIDRAIDRHRDWRDLVTEGAVVCHGDVHPGNVVQTADGPVLLDWDLMCTADPGWDHAMLLTLAERWGGEPHVYRDFATGYGRSLVGDPGATAFADLRNVAATLMRVRAGRTDPAARDEAERRLRFWRGDPDAPPWRAQ
jgi:hypothetical protein